MLTDPTSRQGIGNFPPASTPGFTPPDCLWLCAFHSAFLTALSTTLFVCVVNYFVLDLLRSLRNSLGMENKQTNKISIKFDCRKFVESHGRAPNGTRSWIFEIEGQVMLWSPEMPITEAKEWAAYKALEVAPHGCRVLYVDIVP
jgi:hypothetical protein